MRGCIRASRFLVAIVLASLVWSELRASPTRAEQMAGGTAPVGRPISVTSRGGPRPASALALGRDVLAARPQVVIPSPLPSPGLLAKPEPPIPNPAPQRKLTPLGAFKVTGYSDSPLNGTDGRGITRSGVPTHWGVVAVDPRIIPLGSELIIEGMGDTVFKALDTGGGILGRWIDVWFASDREAVQHGVKHQAVYLVVK